MQNQKKATNGKLSLSKETVRQLTDLDLGGVIGGGPPPGGGAEPTAACTGNCWSNHTAGH
jgi:hypothetical protein